MTFSRDLPKRLLMAKQILNHGLEHAKKNGEINRLHSIISLDGAIENILYTIIIELHGSNKNISRFEGIFDSADIATTNTTNNKLPYKPDLLALHKARNAAQHEGVIPDQSTIQRFMLRSEDFIRQVCELCFKKSFDDIFLADTIQDHDLREAMREAEGQISKNKHKESTISSAKAFTLLISKNEEQESRRGKISLHNPDEIIKEIEYLKERIAVLSLRANIRDYQFFKKNTPLVATMSDGSMKFALHDGIEYSGANSTRVLNFVYGLIIDWEGNPS